MLTFLLGVDEIHEGVSDVCHRFIAFLGIRPSNDLLQDFSRHRLTVVEQIKCSLQKKISGGLNNKQGLTITVLMRRKIFIIEILPVILDVLKVI